MNLTTVQYHRCWDILWNNSKELKQSSLSVQNNNISAVSDDTFCKRNNTYYIRPNMNEIRMDGNPVNLAQYPNSFTCLKSLPIGRYHWNVANMFSVLSLKYVMGWFSLLWVTQSLKLYFTTKTGWFPCLYVVPVTQTLPDSLSVHLCIMVKFVSRLAFNSDWLWIITCPTVHKIPLVIKSTAFENHFTEKWSKVPPFS